LTILLLCPWVATIIHCAAKNGKTELDVPVAPFCLCLLLLLVAVAWHHSTALSMWHPILVNVTNLMEIEAFCLSCNALAGLAISQWERAKSDGPIEHLCLKQYIIPATLPLYRLAFSLLIILETYIQ